VQQASSGPAAIEMLKNDPCFDLVFTDIVMHGGMSGFDVARWAMDNLPRCRVLLTSGFSEKAANEKGIEIQNLRMLEKPYNLIELKKAVSDALGSASGSNRL
jgi:CheY-like chemotaxis protein